MSDYDILQSASLAGAAIAKQYISPAQRNVLDKAYKTSYNNYMAEASLNTAGLNLTAISMYSESGKFSALSHGNWERVSLQDAYLRSLGKLHTGYGSFYANIDAFRTLVKQNGPKRMKERIIKFIERTLKQKSQSS